MPLNLKTTGGGVDYKQLSAGTHFAVCNLVADLGMQPGTDLYPTAKQQILVRFEVPEERNEYEYEGKRFNVPMMITKTFTASMHEKANLRTSLESWRGRAFTDEEAEAFDVSSILGQGFMLSVVEKVSKGKLYANIDSMGKLPKGVPSLTSETPLILYLEDNTDTFGKLPAWVQKKISGQLKPEMKRQQAATQSHPPDDYSDLGITDDDIPF